MKYPVFVLCAFTAACSGPPFRAGQTEKITVLDPGNASDAGGGSNGGSGSASDGGAASVSSGGAGSAPEVAGGATGIAGGTSRGGAGGSPTLPTGGSTGNGSAASTGGTTSTGGSSNTGGSSTGGASNTGGVSSTGGTAPVDDGECDVSGVRIRMQPSSATRTPSSVIASFNGAASFHEVCTASDNMEAYPVFGCCVSTAAVHGRVCVDILLQDLVNPGISIDACGGSSLDARCGDMSQYRILLDGQLVTPQVMLVGNQYALCITAL